MGYSPPGFSVHGIFQAKILECVALSFSRGFPNSVIEPESPVSPALAVGFFTTDSSKAGKSWLLHFLDLPTSNAMLSRGISEGSFHSVISAACVDMTVD